MNRILNILSLICIVLAFFAGRSCHKCSPCPDIIPGKPDTTVSVSVKTDSTAIKPVPVHSSHHNIHPIGVISMVDTGKTDSCSYYQCLLDTNDYEQYFCDSAVMVKSTTSGELLKQSVEFKQKTITINRVDTLIRPPLWSIMLGGMVLGSSSSAGAGPMVIVSYKNTTFSGGYDAIRKGGMLGAAVPLLRSKK